MMADTDELEAAVAFALRERHCSTKQKARIIVTVSPEAAARTAVQAVLEALR